MLTPEGRSDGTYYIGHNTNINAGYDASTETNINRYMFRRSIGSTVLNLTGSRVQIDYVAILRFIKSGPQVLPPNLRAGRVVYYTSIPDTVASTGSDTDQRFWKQYIDYVLGVGSYGNHDQLAGQESRTWPEGNYRFAPIAINQSTTLNQYKPTSTTTDPRPYMIYNDNPIRPRMNFWFGPMSMLDFLATGANGDNMQAGTLHEAQTWQLKAGIQSGIDDIRANHPNDQVGMGYFSGYYNPNNNNDRSPVYLTPAAPMSQQWNLIKNALFYPKDLVATITAGNTTSEVRPYNTSMSYTQRGKLPNGNGSTDPTTGFAQGYNLLSASPSVNADPTLRGRRGATKIVIFETDGVPNSFSNVTYQTQGYNSYYTIQPDWLNYGDNGTPASTDPALEIIDRIVSPASNTLGGSSGFSLPNSPARVYAIGFGDLFSTPTASQHANARAFLLNVQKRGGTSEASASALPAEHIITGSFPTRISNLRTTLERILQGGVQVTLIE